MAKARDSKDPLPMAENVFRQNGDGNEPAVGEKHGQKKAEKVSAASRWGAPVGPDQPTRQNGDGNEPATGEMHNSKKAERVPASARW